MNWRQSPLCGADTETTGINVEEARIVTACVGIASSEGWVARNWLLKQEGEIPAEASAVHGISTDYANAHGVDREQAIFGIREALYYAWSQGWPVIFFNASFDLTIIDRELKRIGEPGLEIRGPVIDPSVADKAIEADLIAAGKLKHYRKGSRKLIDTCAHYGITLDADDAHGAEPDALAATRLAWKLAPQLPSDVDELMTWQADAYREQRESLAAYFRTKKGDPDTAADIEAHLDWPIWPATTQEETAA